MTQFTRKNYLPKKSFQIRLLSKIFIAIALIITLLSATIFVANMKSISKSKETVSGFLSKITAYKEDASRLSSVRVITETSIMANFIKDSLNALVTNMYKVFLLSIFITLVVVSTVFLILSHRIAGPIYRFEQTLIAVRDGDLSVRISLRDKDELKELAEHFNGMTLTLNEKMNSLQKTLTILKADIENNKIDEASKKALIEKINSMQSITNQFKIAYN